METLIIQVDCRPYTRDGPPQLGITVEAPFSQQRSLQQLKKQHGVVDREYQNHDYQNLDDYSFKLTHTSGGSTKLNSVNKVQSNNISKNGHSSLRSRTRQHISNVFNGPHQINEGLQITQIQPGSIIDRTGQFRVGDIIVECNGVNLQRPFAEAQRTLKQFVVEHTSHGPLVLKVLRKSASSSSIPSTAGSQITVIERNNIHSNDPLKKSSSSSMNLKQKASQQQAIPSTSDSPTSPKSYSSSKTSRHLVGALNTRKIGVKHTIRLRKGAEGGFGIKIAERDNMHGTRNRPIYITAITTTGSAYRDGRLKEGDMLLEINGLDLHGKSQPEVTKMLKAVAINEEVEFVVSRQELIESPDNGELSNLSSSVSKMSFENDCDKSLIDLDVPENDSSVFESSNQQFEQKIDNILNIPIKDGPGVYVYDIPLNDTKSAGLGLYLKYPRRADDRKDLGIWIEKVITGGAAWKDGQLQPDDQILAINGINLVDRSNAEASETLTAAVCRGIGPEATPNIIRLKVHRRDPAIVAKILQGTNNRIEYSDIISSDCSRPLSIHDKDIDRSCESYQTAPESSVQYRSNELRYSSDSSNQNSQNDSAMSPQTQASSSLKMTSSYNERSDQNSSDKTNETASSAISQITNCTSNVPFNDVNTADKSIDPESQNATCPKSILTDVNMDCTSSSQSWDDISTDATTGEERFQRDGFGRQSISEKRHAQLNAKNTDTYKRNQKLREEREQQRRLEEQMARQRIDDERRQAQCEPSDKLITSYSTNEFETLYGSPSSDRQILSNHLNDGLHREVPVDVHVPREQKVEISRANYLRDNSYIYTNGAGKPTSGRVTNYRGQIVGNQITHVKPINCCMKCGSTSSCMCGANFNNHQIYVMNPRDENLFKRSNSLESIQQHQVREGLVVPRSGTVRVARNRRVNESFRAAVDRSYEGSINDSNGRCERSDISDSRHASMGNKVTSSIANSTASTSNEERYLIGSKKDAASNNSTTSTTHKKSSSLLTKFLKFGSMKRKKKIRDAQEDTKQHDMKVPSSKSHRDTERSQSSKSSHSRTHSSQSHPNLNSNQSNPLAMKPEVMMNGHMYNHDVKQAVLTNSASRQLNDFDMAPPQQVRSSVPMCHQHYQPLHNTNSHYKVQIQPHLSMTQAKYAQNMLAQPPQVSNTLSAHSQYSHMPVHLNQHQQHNHQSMIFPQHQMAGGLNHIYNHDTGHEQHYASNRNQMILNPQINNRLSNGFQATQIPNSGSHWQSSHFQAPNGLWVTNSPVNDNEALQNIYGTVNQHHEALVASASAHRNPQHAPPQPPQPSSMNNNYSYMPPVNGTANDIFHHAPPHLTTLMSTHPNQANHRTPFNALQHSMHNHQQQQHIQYYDY